jgi:four helix bundle protein
MQDYKKLKVWEKAHAFTVVVYAITQAFPKDEVYALTSQIRRCAVSVPSNIVEGCGRGSNPELVKFLHYALGSANELEYQLVLSRDLGYVSAEAHVPLAASVLEIKRMLAALIVKIKEGPDARPS